MAWEMYVGMSRSIGRRGPRGVVFRILIRIAVFVWTREILSDRGFAVLGNVLLKQSAFCPMRGNSQMLLYDTEVV